MNDIATIIFSILVAFTLGLFTGALAQKEAWRSELVKRDHAQYCPLDGSFAFIGECSL